VLSDVIKSMSGGDQFIYDFMLKGSEKILSSRGALVFGCELAIYRKK
jgi:hypothetical protein